MGLVFLDLGLLKFKSERSRWISTFEAVGLRPADALVSLYALVQIVGGLMLLVGFYTQVAALAFAILTGIEVYLEWREKNLLKRSLVFYILLFGVSVSILLTGAGAFAVDLPL